MLLGKNSQIILTKNISMLLEIFSKGYVGLRFLLTLKMGHRRLRTTGLHLALLTKWPVFYKTHLPTLIRSRDY